MLKDILRFLFRRTSENAAILMITLAEFLDNRHRCELADYLHALVKLDDQKP